MVNDRPKLVATILLAIGVLTAAAWFRGAEYDEQYTLFLTAGTPRPAWPDRIIASADVTGFQSGMAGPLTIAHDLRTTDVHPPLYFWAVSAWRFLGAQRLFAIRLLSVGCALGALWLVRIIAQRTGVPPNLAMLLTLGCYGFAYTAAIARGFALAQVLTLGGIAFVLHGSSRRPMLRGFAGGLLLGVATLTNYLASFVAAAAIVGIATRRRSLAAGMAAGFAVAMPAALWFYLPQRDARTGQFPPFEWLPGLTRLARYAAANVVGGLPLYVGDDLRPTISAALVGLVLGIGALVAVRWRRIGCRSGRLVLLLGTAAPPAGLLALGVVFDTTPIELRYLSFATPFFGLLLAGAIGSLGRRWAIPFALCLLSVQVLAIGGLIVRPETMQPARAAAQAAAELSADQVVLLPFGNDGIGIVGAFAGEAPPALRLLIVRPGETRAAILGRVAPYSRVGVALLVQDGASSATVTELVRIFSSPRWHLLNRSSNFALYERTCLVAMRPSLEGVRNVLRGVHDRKVLPTPGDDPSADRWIGTSAGPAARQSADPCNVASDGSGTG